MPTLSPSSACVFVQVCSEGDCVTVSDVSWIARTKTDNDYLLAFVTDRRALKLTNSGGRRQWRLGGSVSSSKQLRLAVVMNGGVSLAVWMSGATHELNNCRVAHDPAAPPGSRRAAWRAILARANTEVVVDFVAGASAGGPNGTVLARAIATRRDLLPLDALCFERAALRAGKLLPENPVGVRPHVSVDVRPHVSVSAA